MNTKVTEIKGYEDLQNILKEAFDQASTGKGKKRHANNKPFSEQPIMWIEENFKSFQLGQAVKKIHESQNLSTQGAIEELKGAIVSLAAKIIFLRKHEEDDFE